MKFRVVDGPWQVDRASVDVIFLWNTKWDDWFQYSTLYTLQYIDPSGQSHRLGDVKIGQVSLQGARVGEAKLGERKPELAEEFTALSTRYFSVGQDDSYYETLNELGDEFRVGILSGLRDIAYDEKARAIALEERVTTTSLLRSVTMKTVEDQFARMAHGGKRLTPYKFTFIPKSDEPKPKLEFSVVPGSRPPSNIHVLIGRNGVGKSTLLNDLARTMVNKSRKEKPDPGPWDQLSNIVSVSFSAFDHFKPMSVPQERPRGLSYHYVGLKKVAPSSKDENSNKDAPAIKAEMTRSLKLCLVGARRARLRHALSILESDPIFAEAGLAEILHAPLDGDSQMPGLSIEADEAIAIFGKLFGRLSSGHKIVLLSIAKLVETVEANSLVLLDEPEAHLHPPLLSAFVRTLSDLLTNRNGMAVIATHSPVVLQEVPKDCVWKLTRSGNNLRVERPRVETFGENVGLLTDEVFGLEVTATGFHRMLTDAAMAARTYEEALSTFEGKLGSEGRSILRAMMISKANDHVGS